MLTHILVNSLVTENPAKLKKLSQFDRKVDLTKRHRIKYLQFVLLLLCGSSYLHNKCSGPCNSSPSLVERDFLQPVNAALLNEKIFDNATNRNKLEFNTSAFLWHYKNWAAIFTIILKYFYSTAYLMLIMSRVGFQTRCLPQICNNRATRKYVACLTRC